ncbi:MAG: UDP-N-acetylglucosamine 1-carboxyvinyltransferase [Firmicutes bacterium]|nr:UDP-N-acetylglucosamine 1-carboxyvinyltransferase [Bacillota bacterium]
MERLVIRGGRRLAGTVRTSGAKNAVLKLMAASILANEPCLIRNVPRKISDVEVMIGVLRGLGVKVDWEDPTSLRLDPRGELGFHAPDELVREMRASIQVIGPLLGRVGHARVYQPGGCVIGQRPIDLHLKGFAAQGAEVREEHGYIEVIGEKLQGAEIHLDFPSVGATENIMAAAILAEGTTIIRNAAKEPEIIEEQNFYNRLGARIRGAGTDTIRIDGVESLNHREIDYSVIPDRIEVGTFMIAAALTGGDVTVQDVIPEHVEAISAKLREIGAEVTRGEDSLRVLGRGRPKAVDVTVLPYPGFPTDLQSPMAALLSVADGTSIITDHVFEARFRYVDELLRMGANIRVEGRSAIVKGVPRLSGAEVVAPDLRGGAALVLAGLVAEGETTIYGTKHIDRGYEEIERKFQGIGAEIERVID